MERELELGCALRDGREERLAPAAAARRVGVAAGLGWGRGRDGDGVRDVGEEGEDGYIWEGELVRSISIVTVITVRGAWGLTSTCTFE